MIPKIIHYCWFGYSKMKKSTKKYIEGWQKLLPDYEFIEWNESNFDVNSSCDFVKEAYRLKKWAFVADYVRLFALLNYGGIYLDTDVQLIKTFDDYLCEQFFISHESPVSLCTAVIGAEKQHPIIQKFLEYYHSASFIFSDKLNVKPNSELIKDLIAREYGIEITYNNEIKNDNMHIFARDVFCGKDIHNYKLDITSNTVAIHNLDASWYGPKKKILRKCKKTLMSFINLFAKK